MQLNLCLSFVIAQGALIAWLLYQLHRKRTVGERLLDKSSQVALMMWNRRRFLVASGPLEEDQVEKLSLMARGEGDAEDVASFMVSLTKKQLLRWADSGMFTKEEMTEVADLYNLACLFQRTRREKKT